MVPVQLHPLIPEGEGMHLEAVALDLLDEVCCPTLILPPPYVVTTPGGYQVTLDHCHVNLMLNTGPTLSMPIPARPMLSSLSHTAVFPVMFCSSRNTNFRSVLFFTYSRLLISNALIIFFEIITISTKSEFSRAHMTTFENISGKIMKGPFGMLRCHTVK